MASYGVIIAQKKWTYINICASMGVRKCKNHENHPGRGLLLHKYAWVYGMMIRHYLQHLAVQATKNVVI